MIESSIGGLTVFMETFLAQIRGEAANARWARLTIQHCQRQCQKAYVAALGTPGRATKQRTRRETFPTERTDPVCPGWTGHARASRHVTFEGIESIIGKVQTIRGSSEDNSDG
jgi:hypothetical protein